MLTGVAVRISLITRECSESEERSGCQIRTDDGRMHPIPMGTLGPHEKVEMPGFMNSDATPNNSAHYAIAVTAQNGTDFEDLRFRPSIVGNAGAAYTFKVFTGDKMSSNETMHLIKKRSKTVKSVGWTEPTKLPK